MNKNSLVFLLTLAVSLSACSITLQKRTDPIPARVDVDIPAGLVKRTYKINVRYFNLSEIGIPKSVDEIESVVTHFDAKEKGNYYRWDDYRIRHFDLADGETPVESGTEFDQITSDDDAKWKTIEEAIGFSYFVAETIAENGQLTSLPKVDFARKNIDGFRFYLNLIDFHMWDIYVMILKTQKDVGDVYQKSEEGHVIKLLEWENVVKQVDMQGGTIYVQKLDSGDFAKSQQFYFQQNQRLDMQLIAPIRGRLAFEMPYHGSNRFMGIFELDGERRIKRARFNEYVYGKVSAPFFIKVPAYQKREYIIEREK